MRAVDGPHASRTAQQRAGMRRAEERADADEQRPAAGRAGYIRCSHNLSSRVPLVRPVELEGRATDLGRDLKNVCRLMV